MRRWILTLLASLVLGVAVSGGGAYGLAYIHPALSASDITDPGLPDVGII